MRLVSVNVGLPRTVNHEGGMTVTGIFKKPVAGRVPLHKLNPAGDGQADLRVHGGPDKAVYAYPVEHYDFWARELDRDDFLHGQFGENLTVEGMLEDAVHLGDVFRVGDAQMEVTQPRVPCFKLALRMELPGFPKQFLASRRSGFYLRVQEEGAIGAGDEIIREQIGPEKMTVREALELAFFDRENRIALQRALRIPALSASWREDFQEALNNLPPALADQKPS